MTSRNSISPSTAAKANCGYIDRRPASVDRRDGAVNAAIIQSLPSSSRDAARLAARLGIPFHEIAIHRFPDGEIRVTAAPAAPTTIIYASLDRPNEKLIALTVRRRGAAARRRETPGPAGALSLLHAPGHRVPRRRSDQPEGHRRADRRMRRPRRSPSTRICTARPTSERCFRGSSPTICRRCRQ